MVRASVKLLLTVIALQAVLAREAHAYLDPGTGSYILQMVIAGILGALFAIKLFWLRIKGFFGRVFSRDAEND